jgi:aminoglycoside 3-N-acetyltransferase
MSTLKNIAKAIVPESIRRRLRAAQRKRDLQQRPVLRRADLERQLDRLVIREGDTVFLHSGFSNLNLEISVKEVADLLRARLGAKGTLLVPTFPPLPSLEWMLSDQKFDVRFTPSLTGLLPEYVRRLPNAVRSLHPAKSVAAVGPLAAELLTEHHCSVLPFDEHSPFFKLIAARAKIVGLGVPTNYLTFVHAVEDHLKEQFPIEPFDRRQLWKTCVDVQRREHRLSCFSHRSCVTAHSTIPKFADAHLSREALTQFQEGGIDFFVADAERLFEEMKQLALRKLTIYPAQFMERYPRTQPYPGPLRETES